ncbi:FAD-binding oxidoreductase [Candidimonas nitroreducens]|uniref:FAD-binding oxidoreductase n=1 Tax=Candidimonas nitroreducens TaxID=683354 RepID=A0A225MQJ8_9BURK|nr:FAD-binding oxidoreductase [Candidimonas nitroreducens]OWT63495.1 FAD-binding oxidoreductase [Candidimonas nitroreducens]
MAIERQHPVAGQAANSRAEPDALLPAQPPGGSIPDAPCTLESLAQTVSCLRKPADIQAYLQDASGLAAAGLPAMVLRPDSVEQVVQIVRACHQEGRRLTIQGGRSGLAGGAVPDEGDVVLALERLDRVEEFDTVGGTITVQAGMILENLCALVEARGWYFPLDLGARGSCQIGGNVATNAGGNRVLRYGTTRELVLGLEVVLADGTLMTMLNKGLKNNTGLDLKHLFIGTEGTLGVITRVVLRLFPRPERRYSALAAVSGLDQVARLLQLARARLPELSSFEVMWRNYLAAAGQVLQKTPPFESRYPICVLLETEGRDTPEAAAALEGFLGELLESGEVLDAIIPHSQEQAAMLWKFRDAIGEILRTMQPYVAFDIGIPLQKMDAFIEVACAGLARLEPNARNLLFGHLGDGNLHLSTGPHAPENLLAVEELVYREVERVGGSISAEHGIGRIKKPFLKHSRGAAERALMQQVKRALDGDSGLNRHRVIDA